MVSLALSGFSVVVCMFLHTACVLNIGGSPLCKRHIPHRLVPYDSEVKDMNCFGLAEYCMLLSWILVV